MQGFSRGQWPGSWSQLAFYRSLGMSSKRGLRHKCCLKTIARKLVILNGIPKYDVDVRGWTYGVYRACFAPVGNRTYFSHPIGLGVPVLVAKTDHDTCEKQEC